MNDTITLPRQTVQQALEALASYSIGERLGVYQVNDLIAELIAALEQQQAEPVEGNTLLKAFLASAKEAGVTHLQQAEPVGEVINERGEVDYISYVPPVGTVLYTAPPQRKPLTNELEAAFKDGWQSAKAAHGIKEGT